MPQGEFVMIALFAAFVLFITARTDAAGQPELLTYIRLLV
jgi:hypothetical protein